jgi:signal transduction histidine kinase
VNVRGSALERPTFVSCSMVHCVEAALRRYPFVSVRERALVHWHSGPDFEFRGSELLTIHVIFNLLNNALRHIAQAGKGEIWIELRSGPADNSLVFRDTGTGIHPEVLPHIFTRYYAWTKDEKDPETTGIGLAFCREVAQASGGDIVCRSRLGEYTEFVIGLPKKNSA